ncbi:MAG: FAD-dependent monooxygenase [Xanthomonadales bacterium]|nr:FAD-dependent monooxygenase [Xanthomonadales bacterium]
MPIACASCRRCAPGPTAVIAPEHRAVTLVGGGLVGALLATLLARRGFEVQVFERRSDPRRAGHVGGRSINLALAERGLHAVRDAGAEDEVMRLAVMMRGRMVHHRDGHAELLRYGRDDSEVIWSLSRGRLNIALIDAAERAGARFRFDQRLAGATFGEGATLAFHDERSGSESSHTCAFAIGADGAGSALREAMNAVAPLGERIEPLGHGYKELEIPALRQHPSMESPPVGIPASPSAAAGGLDLGPQPSPFAIEPNALHIWPRGSYMCIALPNAEGNFTVTLFLANAGHPSFAEIPDATTARRFFEREFADLLPLLADFDEDFTHNPIGVLSTLYLDRWHLDGRAVLLGDAAHAMVPFHGQGMNCGFEDALELAELLVANPADRAAVFAEFQRRRKPNAEAIIEMALENYVEMRDSVADPGFLLRRELGRLLAERHPGRFVPRYSMVTFSRMPYREAFARGMLQDALLHELCDGLQHIGQVDLARADALVRARIAPIAA